MGKGKIARKKKGRPSKADLGSRAGLRQSFPEKSTETEPRRSLRRRNPTYHDDFYEDDEVEDDEDERREKKLKLVLKLPHKADFGGGSGGGGAGVDSSPSQTRTEGNVGHASITATAAVSASSSDFGDGNKPFKKRKIDGDDGVYNDAEGNDADYDEEDDARSIGSDHRKKERRRNSDSKGMDSAPGTPSGSSAVLSLPDKKSLELILDKLQKKDIFGVYAEPVDPEELPDYHDVIEHPMDFGTVRKKLANGDYSTLEQFEVVFLDLSFQGRVGLLLV